MHPFHKEFHWLAGLWACTLCFGALAQGNPAQRLECVADVYPPYTMEKAGLISGMGADMLVEAGRQVGLDVSVKVLPFARIENELKRGAASNVACAYAFSRTQAREAYMLFGTVPQSVSRYVLFAKVTKGNGVYPGVPGLKNARIGVRFAFRVPESIQQAADRGELTLESVNDDELNFKKLGLGRVDYVLTNHDVGETMLRRLHMNDVQEMRPAVMELAVYVVFNKSMPQATAWRDAIDKGLLAARANRAEQRIRAEYLK
jgi:polar amino acid transport system substrate-binding protein